MDLLRTDRTYATHANARKALIRVCTTLNLTLKETRYLIAATEDGRFAPVVMYSTCDLHGLQAIEFVSRGITVVN